MNVNMLCELYWRQVGLKRAEVKEMHDKSSSLKQTIASQVQGRGSGVAVWLHPSRSARGLVSLSRLSLSQLESFVFRF